LSQIARLDRSNFSASHGVRAAAIVVAPLFLAFATGHPEFIFVTLGALFVTNTEGPNASPLPLPILLLACLTEASAFGLGTLASVTGVLAIPLVALGVFIPLATFGSGTSAQAGKNTAIFFAVGVGLPGGSTGAAVERLWLSLLGGLLAFLGAWLHRALTSRKAPGGEGGAFEPLPTQLKRYARLPRLTAFSMQSQALRHPLTVGAASAVGFAIGLALGLPRDFWIVVTIVIALQPRIGLTVDFTEMMVVGTIVGAVIAAAITVEISDTYLLGVLLLVFATAMFAVKGVNLGLSQVLTTPFIIILLNLLFPGQWQLAEIRVLDVIIGGAVAILTVYLVRIGMLPKRPGVGRPRRPS
jgi:hypothetical protein